MLFLNRSKRKPYNPDY